MAWTNFSIWRGRLPHWRADGVSYYVTFRHRRPLTPEERTELMGEFYRSHGKRWNLTAVCILPDKTELITNVNLGPDDTPHELSDIVEKVKARAAKAIMKKSGERYPPYYAESYDRIIRDTDEWTLFLSQIMSAPAIAGETPPESPYEWLELDFPNVPAPFRS